LAVPLTQHHINERRTKMTSIHKSAGVLAALLLAPSAWASLLTFESSGPDAAAITATRDAFRSTLGGGSIAAANGSFGGLRREINWDGVPAVRSDPNLLPADFFNVNSPRGVVFSTPGSGFLVSTNGGAANPTLFGFPGDFQTFSAEKLFTAVNSNITDITFFVPGTTVAATTSAFGAVFVDVEVRRVEQNGVLRRQRRADLCARRSGCRQSGIELPRRGGRRWRKDQPGSPDVGT
jgi:hypothetical protein